MFHPLSIKHSPLLFYFLTIVSHFPILPVSLPLLNLLPIYSLIPTLILFLTNHFYLQAALIFQLFFQLLLLHCYFVSHLSIVKFKTAVSSSLLLRILVSFSSHQN